MCAGRAHVPRPGRPCTQGPTSQEGQACPRSARAPLFGVPCVLPRAPAQPGVEIRDSAFERAQSDKHNDDSDKEKQNKKHRGSGMLERAPERWVPALYV